MIRTNSLYETCQQLFVDYPLAAGDVGESGFIRSMVLMLPEGGNASFFMLMAYQHGRTAAFSLFPWRADGGVDIRPDGNAVPDPMAAALTRGMPIPRDGSLFGWAGAGTVTALIGVQARYTPTCPLPSWTVLPLASIPAAQWPPFAGEQLPGPWFWEYYRAGSIVLLDALIAGSTGLVFWVDTKGLLGADCCVVADDIKSAAGYTLPHGCYVYSQVLGAGKKVPSADLLLANLGKTDLGPHFLHARARLVTGDQAGTT